jgi:probable HAF family extracellular repeat protein
MDRYLHIKSLVLYIVLVTATLLLSSSATIAQTYTVTEITGIPSFIPEDINNSGQVVGYSCPGNWTTTEKTAYIWQGGVATALGDFGGDDSVAYALNESGIVVGASKNIAGKWQAFKWDNTNGMVNLGTLGGDESWAVGINDYGDIVGGAETTEMSNQNNQLYINAFKYSGNSMTNIGRLSNGGPWPATFATHITNSGIISGTTSFVRIPFGSGGFNSFIFQWTSGVGFTDYDLGVLQGANNSGDLVGWTPNTNTWGYQVIDDIYSELASLVEYSTCYGADINDSGTIVGMSDGGVATRWISGLPENLNDLTNSNVVLTEAVAISNNGKIVSYGYAPSTPAVPRVYILSP